ncbi:hypothetical protein QYM36_006563 [Artemia franciscana]|uniref:Integrase catalytic domain-containing protein n=1 Tax=Artemia franciscana TaxID=6661 RepID=A0AA88KR69_ARTSF|nr:hypothetical protein QYM36_019024 [Artemia franciscana]KAK2717803.1 hypothetical protein QYM36_006563 [Artemia franciscana]
MQGRLTPNPRAKKETVKTKEAFMVIRSQTTHLSSKSLSGPSSEPEAHKASTVVLHDSKPYDMSYVTELQDVLNSGQKILKTEVTILSRFSTTDQSDSKNDGLISNTTTQIRNPGSFQELENNVASFSERKPTGSATLFHLQANGLTLNFLKEKALQEFDGSLPQHFLFQDGMYYRLLTDHLGRTNKQLIVPNPGTQFLTSVLKKLYQILNIKTKRTSPNHPETDGQSERFNEILISMLHKYVGTSTNDWHKFILFILFAYRKTTHAYSGFGPLDQLYGRPFVESSIRNSYSWSPGPTERIMEDKTAEDLIIVAKYSTDAREIIKNLQFCHKNKSNRSKKTSDDAEIIFLDDNDIQLYDTFAKLVRLTKNLYTDEDFKEFPSLRPIKESVTNDETSSVKEELQPVLSSMNHATKTRV